MLDTRNLLENVWNAYNTQNCYTCRYNIENRHIPNTLAKQKEEKKPTSSTHTRQALRTGDVHVHAQPVKKNM